MACVSRIAVQGATLGEAFVSMGLVPDGGETYFLTRLVGLAKAAKSILTGEPIPPAGAQRMGLIDRVVPNQDLKENRSVEKPIGKPGFCPESGSRVPKIVLGKRGAPCRNGGFPFKACLCLAYQVRRGRPALQRLGQIKFI